jgi:hypothetical protein
MSHLVSAALHNGIRFLLSPLPARLWALLTRSFPLQETYGLTMFRTKDNSRFRFSLFAGSVECPCEEISKPLDPATVPFGSSLTASLACCVITTFIKSLRLLTMPRTLAPHCFEACSYVLASRFGRPWDGWDTLSEGFRRFVTLPPYLLGYCRWDGRSGHCEWAEPDNLSYSFMSHSRRNIWSYPHPQPPLPEFPRYARRERGPSVADQFASPRFRRRMVYEWGAKS